MLVAWDIALCILCSTTCTPFSPPYTLSPPHTPPHACLPPALLTALFLYHICLSVSWPSPMFGLADTPALPWCPCINYLDKVILRQGGVGFPSCAQPLPSLPSLPHGDVLMFPDQNMLCETSHLPGTPSPATACHKTLLLYVYYNLSATKLAALCYVCYGSTGEE